MSNNTSRLQPFCPVPKLDPNSLGPYQAFRETFLAKLRDPELNEAFRVFGVAQYEFAFERPLPRSVRRATPIEDTAHDLQAAVSDLRHLQRILALLKTGREEYEREDDEDEAKRHDVLARLAGGMSKKIAKLADELDQAAGDWKFGSWG